MLAAFQWCTYIVVSLTVSETTVIFSLSVSGTNDNHMFQHYFYQPVLFVVLQLVSLFHIYKYNIYVC